MSHGITEVDKGAVGYVEKFGKTWHGLEQYKHMEGKVPMEICERIGNYEVVKVPLHMTPSYGSKVVDGSNCLIRTDTKDILYHQVGNVYEVVQNQAILDWVEDDILREYKNISIESCGTLYGGQKFFVNLLIQSYKVNGDVSETKQRLMIVNPFGGKAITCNLHDTRVVCDNTVRNAQAQGSANKTLKRFKHTATAHDRLKAHALDLADIFRENEAQIDRFNVLASQKVNVEQVNTFLSDLFPYNEEKDSKRKVTMAKNRQEQVLELYETKDDLIALDHSKYRLLNAVTDFADHHLTVKNGDDQGKRFWSNLDGTSNDLKQQAFNMLLTTV
jgi:phage/plasmid-like protein (TIGR03299 family)